MFIFRYRYRIHGHKNKITHLWNFYSVSFIIELFSGFLIGSDAQFRFRSLLARTWYLFTIAFLHFKNFRASIDVLSRSYNFERKDRFDVGRSFFLITHIKNIGVQNFAPISIGTGPSIFPWKLTFKPDSSMDLLNYYSKTILRRTSLGRFVRTRASLTLAKGAHFFDSTSNFYGYQSRRALTRPIFFTYYL